MAIKWWSTRRDQKSVLLSLALVLGLELSPRTNFESLALALKVKSLALSKSPWPWTNRSLALQDLWFVRLKQEAQLPQRNSASAAHMEGAGPSSPLSLRPLWLHLCVWSNPKSTTYVGPMSSVPSTKRTLRWIAHSRSFKVILIGAGRHPERCVVVMCN